MCEHCESARKQGTWVKLKGLIELFSLSLSNQKTQSLFIQHVVSEVTGPAVTGDGSSQNSVVTFPMLAMNILGAAATIFTSKADLQAAVRAYDANSTDAIATYGPIAG